MIDPLNRRNARTEPSLPSWLPPRADALTRSGDAAFVFTLFATADLVACGAIAGFAVGLSHGLVPFLTALAILVAVQKPFVDRIAWRLLGPAGPFVAWSWFAGVSALFAMGASVALHDPIVCSHFRCGTGDIAFVLASPIVVLVVGAFVTLVLRHFVSPRQLRKRSVLAWAAPVVFGLAAIATVAQTARALFVPDAQGYFDRMQEVAVFPSISWNPMSGPDRGTDPEPTRTFVDRQGGLELTRVCGMNSHGCDVNVRFGSDISLAREAHDGFRWAGADDTIRVFRDPQRPVFVFVREDRTSRANDYSRVHPARGYFTAAYDTSRRDWVSISAADIARGSAAPRGWLAGAIAGLLVAGYFAVTMRRARNAMRSDLARFREAHLGTDTTLTFADGTAPIKIAGASDFGPVVVLGGGDPENAHYRDDGRRATTLVAFGTSSHLRTAANQFLWGRGMYALAVLLLASAPILAFTYVQIP